ncbi:MAG: 2Fe-2S iron-sulfur cluster-binding protein [Deltaproteobacteria bacterium]
MPIVTFLPSGKTVEVEFGTLLFDAARKAGLPVASSCSADHVCGRCNMQIAQGKENLSKPTLEETKLLQRDKNPISDRISCMTRVEGDCSVTTRYW